MTLIVIGCQKSGTKSIAIMLGLNHEVRFNYALNSPQEALYNLNNTGEASWMATPYSDWLVQQPHTNVIRVVRHPLNVIKSTIVSGIWTDPKWELYRRYIEKFLPEIVEIEDAVQKSLYYWVRWNKLAKPVPTIQIESIQFPVHVNKHRYCLDIKLPNNDLKEEAMSMYNYGMW